MNPIEIPISLLGGDDVISGLEAIKTSGAEAFTQIAEAASRGDFTGLATMLGGDVAGGFAKATQSALEFVKSQAQAVERLSDLAEAAGSTYTRMQGLEEAFAAGGVSAQGFERSMAFMARTVNQAWIDIQESSRVASTQEQSAQLGMQRATLDTEKAYRDLQKTMSDVAQQATHNANSTADAQLALQRARLTQAKDSGEDVSDAEKSLKAQENAQAVVTAQQRVADAFKKSQDDAAEASSKMAEAQLKVQEATIRTSEVAEKMHQVQLKDIGTITSQIEQVAEGNAHWADSNLLVEASSRTLTESLINLASHGTGIKPNDEEVLKTAAQLFQHMGNSVAEVAGKTEITQRLFGASVRSMGASASQLMQILSKGPEELEKFQKAAEDLKNSGIGINDKDRADVKEFNVSFAELGATIGSVTQHMAGLSAGGFTAVFDGVRASINDSDGALHKFIESIGTVIEAVKSIGPAVAGVYNVMKPLFTGMVDVLTGVIKAASGIIEAIAGIITSLTGLADKSEVMHVIEFAVLLVAAAFTKLGFAIESAMAKLVPITALIGLVSKAVGELIQGMAVLLNKFGLLSDESAKSMSEIGKTVESGGNAVIRGLTMGLSDRVGITDKLYGGEKDQNAQEGATNNAPGGAGVNTGTISNTTITNNNNNYGGGGAGAPRQTTADLPGMSEQDRQQRNADIQSGNYGAGDFWGPNGQAHGQMLDQQQKDKAEYERLHGTDTTPPAPVTDREKWDDLSKKYGTSSWGPDATAAFKKGEGDPLSFFKGQQWPNQGDAWNDPAKKAGIQQQIDALNNKHPGQGLSLDEAGQMATLQNRTSLGGPYDLQNMQYSQAMQDRMQTAQNWKPNQDASAGNSEGAQGAQQAADAISKIVQPTNEFSEMLGSVAKNGSELQSFLHTLGNDVGDLSKAIQSAISGITSPKAATTTNNDAGGGAPAPAATTGMAGGGGVRGPGGPREDRAGLFWLSNGEYVMQAAAVDHYGQGFFDSLNGMMVGGMASGGPVAPRPSIAATGPTSVVNLTIGDQKFNGLRAPENVARSLKQYAITRQSASTGKAPSWMK